MEEESQIIKGKYAADISSIKEAHDRIKSLILKTPVLSSASLDAMSGRQLHFKCENFQKGGAFKFRGASNAVFSLNDEEASKGVITHSSGNHAAALALAAKLRGIPAYIVIPKNAPTCKVENVKRYGGQVIWSEANMRSREEVANKVWQETGAIFIHPYNDGRILSGQGTISLEFLEQAPQIDTLVVPISGLFTFLCQSISQKCFKICFAFGIPLLIFQQMKTAGGGLISGVALAAKSINPAIRILAAEPKGADDAAQSKAAGRIITLPETNTIADGLRAFLGDFTWPVVRDLVEDIITVEDSEIIKAMKLCFEILKIVVEPSGAIGLAAVLSETFQKNPAWKDCKHIGIVVSGGNVDMAVLWDSLKK
ncbi:serine racemase isoform X1 [Trifolium pratense]|uniref:serine racemase isoform X1 n=1 Tax=Trifolium pratense TaxID=57577 RepID=UPI001E697793|nr:serine racemase isoform X1 [Trifolium pratense]